MDRELMRSMLLKLGVTEVTARYDGEGDDGSIEPREFRGKVDTTVTDALQEATENLFYDLLDEHYRGWENNEGAFGELVWDLGADRIHVVHNERCVEFTTTEVDL